MTDEQSWLASYHYPEFCGANANTYPQIELLFLIPAPKGCGEIYLHLSDTDARKLMVAIGDALVDFEAKKIERFKGSKNAVQSVN